MGKEERIRVYFVYMLRCRDDSVYTGITTDLARRMQEHASRGKRCAKYTARHAAKQLECAWRTDNRSLASRLEYFIKTLSKREKERLIAGAELSSVLSGKIRPECYCRLEENQLPTAGQTAGFAGKCAYFGRKSAISQ